MLQRCDIPKQYNSASLQCRLFVLGQSECGTVLSLLRRGIVPIFVKRSFMLSDDENMSFVASDINHGASCFHGDVDPLGILYGRNLEHREQGVNPVRGDTRYRLNAEHFEMDFDLTRDPYGAIAAILKRSKDVRDRVSSRQVSVLRPRADVPSLL